MALGMCKEELPTKKKTVACNMQRKRRLWPTQLYYLTDNWGVGAMKEAEIPYFVFIKHHWGQDVTRAAPGYRLSLVSSQQESNVFP